MNASEKLQEGTVILDVVFHRPGCKRHERGDKVETQANKRWLGVTKRIFESDAYDEARKVQDEAYSWLRKRSVPCGLRGYFVLPVSVLPEVCDHLDKVDAELKEKVERFASERDAIEASAEDSLKDMFRKGQMPSAAYIRRAMWCERRLIELGVPGEAKVGDAMADAERAKAKRLWEDAAAEASLAFREEMAELVGHLASALSPNPDGSRKRLYESALTKVVEWTELFAKRDVFGSEDLSKLADRCRLLLQGRDAETIKSSDRLRGKLAEEFGKVKAALDEQIENAPSRKISFDDE